MNLSILGAVFYSMTFVGAVLGTLLLKKTDQKLLLVSWLPAVILLVTCYQCFVAAVVNIIHIPVNTWSLGIGNGLVMTFFMVASWRKKELQRFDWDFWDTIFSVVLIGVVCILAYKHYGGIHLWPNYNGIDASQHWKSAMEVYSNQSVSGMFYDKLFNGMLFQVFLNWIPIDYSYKVFVLGDLIDFMLAAAMFYGVLREIANKTYAKIIALLLTFMFVLGYQLDAILEGFVYLGMGVTLIVLVTFLLLCYERNVISEKINLIYLMLALLGVVLCYSLFAPFVYICVIAVIFVKQSELKELVSVNTVKKCLLLFAIPCLIGFYYSFLGIFGGYLSVGTQIAAEGAIYKDFFSNFIFIAIFAVLGIYQTFKNKKNLGICILLLGSTLVMLLLLIGGMLGKISAYYFYKMYFVEWALGFEMVFCALASSDTKEESVLKNAVLAIWVLILVNGVLNTGAWIQNRNPLYNENVKSPSFADVYVHNVGVLGRPVYDLYKQELFHQAYQMMESKEANLIVIASHWNDSYWYQAFTNLRWEAWDFQNDLNYFARLCDMKPDYIVVLNDSDLYSNNKKYFDKAERVYSNRRGEIIRFDEQALQQYLNNK